MSAVERSGSWQFVSSLVGGTGVRVNRALDFAVKREALRAERNMKKGIRSGAPGGKIFKALSAWTIIKRKAQGFRGRKPLIRRRDLARSIRTVGPVGGAYFVGVLRTARGKDGQTLANVARIQEEGRTIVLNVDKPGRTGRTVRSYFWALVRKGLIKKPLKAATKFLVITIPPRPFIQPTFDQMKKGRGDRMLFDIRSQLFGGVV